MVRASASSLAAVSAAETDASTSPASRVADLGEFFDQSLKIHEPAGDTVEIFTEPLNDMINAERLRIPFAAQEVSGFVFVRVKFHNDSPPTYEAAVFFNGSCVSSIDGCPTRREAIVVVEKDLYAKIARTQAFRNEARELNAIIHALVTLGPDEHIPAGEPCEWPIVVDEAADESTDTTTEVPADAAANAAGEACGEVRVVAATAAPVGPTPEEVAAARQRAENAYNAELQAARERHNEAGLYRLGLEDDLKEAKKQEKTALEALRDISQSGPDYRRFAPVAASAQTSTATATTSTPLPPPSPEYTPTSPQAGEAQPSGPRDDWQSTSIDMLGLPPSLTEKLKEAGCPTIGKLEALRGSFEGLKSIAGIGQAKADQIEEAVLGWLSRNRDASTLSAAKEAAVVGEAVALEAAAQGQ